MQWATTTGTNQRFVQRGPLVLTSGSLRFSYAPQQIGTELSHDVLNPAPRAALMGRTAQPLGPSPAPGRGRADIEVPNLPVDMSSWGRSACYPQSTFYPLSDSPSMRNYRITISYFRTCSACRPHSQAPLCYYAPCTITIRAEGTFESLRYFLGGDHPSQTTRHTMSPYHTD